MIEASEWCVRHFPRRNLSFSYGLVLWWPLGVPTCAEGHPSCAVSNAHSRASGGACRGPRVARAAVRS
eukprot:scaffold179324_cov33-Tisochrysis_lutea.AAC.1